MTTITVEELKPIVGFISPSAWYDPSPSEFLRITESAVRVQQFILSLFEVDWRIESITASEPEQMLSARTLGQAGCDVIASVGTPFAWAD